LIVAGKAANWKEGVAFGTKSLDSGAAALDLKHFDRISTADMSDILTKIETFTNAKRSQPPSAKHPLARLERWRKARRRRAVLSMRPHKLRAGRKICADRRGKEGLTPIGIDSRRLDPPVLRQGV